MLNDCYDIISKYAVISLLIENKSFENENIFNTYLSYRKIIFKFVYENLISFINCKEIRSLEYPKYHTRLIIETLAWWGMHRKYDSFDINEQIPDDISKKIPIDTLVHAYKLNRV